VVEAYLQPILQADLKQSRASYSVIRGGAGHCAASVGTVFDKRQEGSIAISHSEKTRLLRMKFDSHSFF
jgi:hypothetical protein